MAMTWVKRMGLQRKQMNARITVMLRPLQTQRFKMKILQQARLSPVLQRRRPWRLLRKKNQRDSSLWPICTVHRFMANAKNYLNGSTEKISQTSHTKLLYTVLMVKRLIVQTPTPTKANNKLKRL